MRIPSLLALLILAWPPGLMGQAAAGCNPVGNVRFVCGQQAPEDLVAIPGSPWILVSSYAGTGGINLINVRDHTTTVAFPTGASKERLDAKTYDTCPGPPEPVDKAKFVTHGLALSTGSGGPG